MFKNLSYLLLSQGIGKMAAHTFFKTIDVIGLENVPKDQPVIICSNHNNQFTDAILISSVMNRLVKFIVAAKSMRRPMIGTPMRALGGIPVERAQDIAKPGKGKIISLKNGVLIGEGTSFTKDFQIGFSISLQMAMDDFLVQQIVSDTELRVKQEEELSATSFSSAYKIIPKIDQHDMYQHVWQALLENDCIGIFPEGGSHDRTDFLPLKAGVCIMALGAMALHNIQVNIVCCGLNYYACDKFRSKVIIEFGQPYKIPMEAAELYKKSKREAISELLHEIEYRLRDVTTSVPSYKDLMGVMMTRQIYLPDNIHITPKEELQLNRKFAKGYIQMIDKPQIKSLFQKIKEYRSLLKITSMDDYQVKLYERTQTAHLAFFCLSLLTVIFYFLLVAPFMIVNGPIGVYLNYMSEKERIKCQRESKVKILGKDVVASYKIMLAVVMLPVQFGLITLLFSFVFIPFFLPILESRRLLSTLIFMALYPPYSYLMVLYSDKLVTHFKNMIGSFNGVFNEQQCLTLKSIRNKLQIQIREYVNSFGGEVFKNFDETKVISDKKILASKQKPEIHQTLEKAVKRISSTELMQRIFSVLEDIGI